MLYCARGVCALEIASKDIYQSATSNVTNDMLEHDSESEYASQLVHKFKA